MTRHRRDSYLRVLLRIVDEAYEKGAWHGPNLKGSLRGVTARQAAWKPSTRRHSIWELVRHATYWKYAVRRRLLGEKRGSFPIKGSNWFQMPPRLTVTAWKSELAVLEEIHSSLRHAISKMNSRDFRKIPQGSKVDAEKVVYGIAFHDVYHAGQIQLLKRMQKES